MLEVVRAYLVSQLKVNPEEIREATSFRFNIEVDSLETWSLERDIEHCFGVDITLAHVNCVTVKDVIDLTLHAYDRHRQ